MQPHRTRGWGKTFWFAARHVHLDSLCKHLPHDPVCIFLLSHSYAQRRQTSLLQQLNNCQNCPPTAHIAIADMNH